MKVKKRSGRLESVKLDKILKRIKFIANEEKDGYYSRLNISDIEIAKKVVDGLYDGVTTKELDQLAARTAASMGTRHYDYLQLAGRIEVSRLHKETPKTFSSFCSDMNELSIINDNFNDFVQKNSDKIDAMIDPDLDYKLDYFGFKTLERSYLLKDKDGFILERPCYMWMRTAIQVSDKDLDKIYETYKLLADGYYTHATPTLFNSGTNNPQLSSCFLIDIDEDSINGIFKTLSDCAQISKHAGGIGISINKIRSVGSGIAGTNGNSNGIVPMLRVFDATARYVDQCFEGDTIVYTTEGAKQISKIVRGDLVLTKDGSYKKVVSSVIHDAEERDGYSISLKKSLRSINVTESHPFYSITNQKIGLNFSKIKNRLDKGIVRPDYRPISELNIGDFVGFPLCKNVIDNDSFSVDDCYLYGLILGDGYVSESGAFTLHFGHHEYKQIEFVKNYCKLNSIEYDVDTSGRHTKISTNKPKIVRFSRAMVYDDNKEKLFHKSMQFLTFEKSMSIIRGLMDSDGHYGKKELLLEMTSRNVIEAAKFVLMRFGILTSGYERDRIGKLSSYDNIETKKKTTVLRIPRSSLFAEFIGESLGSHDMSFVHDGISWCRIAKKEPVKINSILYDLEVDENENYTTEIGLVHNGGNKRKGSFAIYLEPWHSDIFEFLDLKKNHGKEEMRARDLFYGLWIPDLFMQRVHEDGMWTLFDPKRTKEENGEGKALYEIWGEEFNEAYVRLEKIGVGTRKVKARDLWNRIIESQIETGTPYILYKDHINKKSNQKNLGTIKSSNLCTEICEYTSPEETAVCNLASISLPKFIKDDWIDIDKLVNVSRVVCRNLNNVIDSGFYPTKEAKYSNFKNRPIGIGVQGLADLFAQLKLPFTSEKAKELNRIIFEAIYYGAVTESISLAAKHGVYESFEGSPSSMGQLQFDLWEEGKDLHPLHFEEQWREIKSNLPSKGMRNSLLIAPMPTASTSQILGNNEAFEPFNSNIYSRRTLGGDFVIINKHLIKDLENLGMWDDSMIDEIIHERGSVQNIERIPDDLKEVYKTVWELKMKDIIEMAADRGRFICQSQSMNIFFSNPNISNVTSSHFYAWELGLKTGCYYLRSKPATNPVSLVSRNKVHTKQIAEDPQVCSLDDPDCEACSS